VCEFADHIYAREETSFRYITEALGESAAGKVSVAPDFTCLYKGEPYSLLFKEKDYVVIIPNRQMLAKTGVGGNYCDFIIRVVRFLRENGIKTVFLNHEGEGDGFLISVFNAYIGNSGHVVTNVSGGECKKVISGAKLVLTARFHGLVSALSEGVPVLCTSWSHKYQELVTEMGCGNSCVDISSREEAFGVFLDSFEHPDKYSSPVRNRLVLGEKVKEMWD
jgi:colanic acid/amylovoran biosynthesis protein